MRHHSRHTSSSRETAQLVKAIVAQVTSDPRSGDVQVITKDGKNAAAVVLGRLGGAKGGIARAVTLTRKARSAIARKAARARWKKSR